MKIIQEGPNYICTDCQYVTSIKQVLKKHIEAQHISPGVMCEICHKISPTRHALRMHLKRVHNTLPKDTSYQQLIYTMFYTMCFELKFVMLSGGSSTFATDLESYLLRTNDVIQCSFCDYNSKNIQHVKNHIEARHMDKVYTMYTCEICYKSCPTRNSLYVHKSRVHYKNKK